MGENRIYEVEEFNEETNETGSGNGLGKVVAGGVIGATLTGIGLFLWNKFGKKNSDEDIVDGDFVEDFDEVEDEDFEDEAE